MEDIFLPDMSWSFSMPFPKTFFLFWVFDLKKKYLPKGGLLLFKYIFKLLFSHHIKHNTEQLTRIEKYSEHHLSRVCNSTVQ